MFFLVIASILWGLSFALIKGGLQNIDPYFIAFLRTFAAFLIFLPFLKFSVTRIVRVKLMMIGAAQFGMMYIFYLSSFQYLKAHEVALFTLFTPIWVFIISAVIKKEFSALIFFIVLINTFFVIILKEMNFIPDLKGVFLVQISNFVFALGMVLYKNLDFKQSNTSAMAYCYLGATIVTIIPLFFRDLSQTNLSKDQWFLVLYLGIVPSGVAFWLWNSGSKMVSSALLAITNNLKIPIAIFLAAFILKEDVSLLKLAMTFFVYLLSVLILRRQ